MAARGPSAVGAVVLAAVLGSTIAALGAATSAQKCEHAKNVAAARYAACRLAAEAKFALTGGVGDRATALVRCSERYKLKWPVIEAKAGGSCPTTDDQAAIQACLDQATTGVANALAGGALVCGDAGSDQTQCFDVAGDVVSCNGTATHAEPQAARVTLRPTEPQLLMPPDTGTGDEDPSLLRARDGYFYLAWVSDRGGNDDVYVRRSRDGLSWGAPVRVTTSVDPDWCPHLVQTGDGRFHWYGSASTAGHHPTAWC